MSSKAVLAAALVILAAGTGNSVRAQEQPVRIVPFSGYARIDLDEAIDNVECMLGFTSVARYHHYGLSGFAARLSVAQLRRLELSGLVGRPIVERGNFLLRVSASDPAAAERRMAELERTIGFRVDLRFGRGEFRGWGAVLDWSQLLLLDFEPDVFSVTENPSGYVVWFDRVYGGAAVRRAAELGRKYGFQPGFVLEGLGGFYAVLSNSQLAALSQEADLATYTSAGAGGIGFTGLIHVKCLHPSRRDRRELAQAFRRAHPRSTMRGPVGRVLYARIAVRQQEAGEVVVTKHAIAAFRVGAAGRTVTELFRRKVGGHWRDRGPVGDKVCADKVPEAVLQTWLFRPVSPHGCYTRN